MEANFFHAGAEEQASLRRDITNLRLPFRNFANKPKKLYKRLSKLCVRFSITAENETPELYVNAYNYSAFGWKM
jgi:hypothetical protein